jgi:hypothetical protein
MRRKWRRFTVKTMTTRMHPSPGKSCMLAEVEKPMTVRCLFFFKKCECDIQNLTLNVCFFEGLVCSMELWT